MFGYILIKELEILIYKFCLVKYFVKIITLIYFTKDLMIKWKVKIKSSKPQFVTFITNINILLIFILDSKGTWKKNISVSAILSLH